MKESRKEHLQITEWERHFYYWNLIYDYCLISIISVLLYRNEEQCWELWATLLNSQDSEDSNKQTTLPASKYLKKTEIQNSVEGQKTMSKQIKIADKFFKYSRPDLEQSSKVFLLTGGEICISTEVKINF